MAYIQDMSRETYNEHPDDGYQYLSVGWLEDLLPWQGVTSPEIVEALIACKRKCQLPDHWRGLHTCQLCRNHHEKGEFFVVAGNQRYVLPNMVTHYIETHRYRLPVQVEDALGMDD